MWCNDNHSRAKGNNMIFFVWQKGLQILHLDCKNTGSRGSRNVYGLQFTNEVTFPNKVELKTSQMYPQTGWKENERTFAGINAGPHIIQQRLSRRLMLEVSYWPPIPEPLQSSTPRRLASIWWCKFDDLEWKPGTHWGSRLRIRLVGLDVQTESDLERRASPRTSASANEILTATVRSYHAGLPMCRGLWQGLLGWGIPEGNISTHERYRQNIQKIQKW